MRALLFFAAVAGSPLVSGCRHPGSAKLEGRWRGTRADGVSPEVQVAANAFARGTEIVVKGDQIVIAAPPSGGKFGTYVVDAEDKGSLVVHTDKDPNVRETLTFSDDGKTMAWKVDAARSIVFERISH